MSPGTSHPIWEGLKAGAPYSEGSGEPSTFAGRPTQPWSPSDSRNRPFPVHFSAAPFNLLENRFSKGIDLPRVTWPLREVSRGQSVRVLPTGPAFQLPGNPMSTHTPSSLGAEAPQPRAMPPTPTLSSLTRPRPVPDGAPECVQGGGQAEGVSREEAEVVLKGAWKSLAGKSTRENSNGNQRPWAGLLWPHPSLLAPRGPARDTEAWPSAEHILAPWPLPSALPTLAVPTAGVPGADSAGNWGFCGALGWGQVTTEEFVKLMNKVNMIV